MNGFMGKPTLVVMAAGLGKRFGGIKQLEPMGPNGELLLEYSIYDAIQAGFGKITFVIREELQVDFHSTIGRKLEKLIEIEYCYQEISDIPANYQALLKSGRLKPWGTAHAIYCCRKTIETPFAVINADDFYGSQSFKLLHSQLDELIRKKQKNCHHYYLVGFPIGKTLSNHGSVARAICILDLNKNLIEIEERTNIRSIDGNIIYTDDMDREINISEEITVSMNMWGFTPDFFHDLSKKFNEFLENLSEKNTNQAEFLLPTVIKQLLSEKIATVRVLSSEDQWFGVTYQKDKTYVQRNIQNLITQGFYPYSLWE